MKKEFLNRAITIAGIVLVGLPLLAPFLFGILSFFAGGRFRFDYLMPAELFPLVLAGGGLLLWAALRMHSRSKLVGWGLAAAAGALVLTQATAVLIGLAHGDAEPTGWRWALVISFLMIYILAVIVVFSGGILLLYDLFKHTRKSVLNPKTNKK